MNLSEILITVGHQAAAVENRVQALQLTDAPVRFIPNPDFRTTNNLMSLYLAHEAIGGEDFLLINGDVVMDMSILFDLAQFKTSAIATDPAIEPPRDAPMVRVEHGFISDIGRDLYPPLGNAYAVGAYMLRWPIHDPFFSTAKTLLSTDPMSGFYDPLRQLFNTFPVQPCLTRGRPWMDIDSPGDVRLAQELLYALNR